RKRAEEELEEANRRKDQFLATLAHELRNPLAPMRNGLEVMKLRGDERAVRNEMREMIERQLDHMIRLINDLLDVSRISRGRVTIDKQRLAMADVLQQALETVRPQLDGAGHELVVSVPQEPIHVEGDSVRLVQVFANLLSNAVKFTVPSGRITLTVECQREHVVVTVADSGIGIAPAMLDKVFELFAQVDSSLERDYGGLGIGLALAKNLVELHGGSICANSAGIGQGSEFTVRLPIAPAVAQGV